MNEGVRGEAPSDFVGFRVNPAWQGRSANLGFVRRFRRSFLVAAMILVELAILPILVVRAFVARLFRKRIDAGFGPDPLINNVHHRKAMELAGYSAQTFCIEPSFITGAFDRVFVTGARTGVTRLVCLFVGRIRCAWWVLGQFHVLYTSFVGGPLAPMVFLARIEPFLLRLADVRTVMLPYGGDVHVPERLSNLAFRFALDFDYPKSFMRSTHVRRRVAVWTKHADCVLAGCDWVDCLDHCDVLCYSHFAIDETQWDAVAPTPPAEFTAARPLRILHAPNHRAIKGTDAFVAAVEQLRSEGCHIELHLMERQSNDSVKAAIQSVDVVADQLIIGWYAMFAIEGMAMRRPVLCHLRNDLLALHEAAGTAPQGGFPLVRCDCASVGSAIRDLYRNPGRIPEAGECGRKFVEHHHSLAAGARLFRMIQCRLGIEPTRECP